MVEKIGTAIHLVSVTGDYRANPTQAFLILEENAVLQPSLLHVIDACFKKFFILDLQYPSAC